MSRTNSYFLRPLMLLMWAALAVSVVAVVLASPPARAATTLTVTTAVDELNTNDPNNQCSLREAIINANQNDDQSGSADCVAGAGDDTIVFDQSLLSGQTITLTSTLPAITDSEGLTIDGGSANGSANITVSGDNTYRVFEVGSGAKLTLNKLTVAKGSNYIFAGGILNSDGGTLTVSNSTISGNSSSEGYGGGIYNGSGTLLEVSNSTFSGNSANQGGGGIFSGGGTLTVSNSTFSGNSAKQGGGIYGHGTLTVSNSTISKNSAAGGGGIINGGGTLTVSNSTISENSATHYAGGIYNADTLTVSNSTISGNSATSYGGGIFSSGRTATVSNSTLSENRASQGGGILSAYGDTATLKNTIVANSPSGSNCSVLGDPPGTINDGGYNLDSDGSCGFGTTNNSLSGTPDNPLDPKLDDALDDNGGPTQTYALLEGSPAIDKGNNDFAVDPDGNTLQFDQRGQGFARIVGGTVDIGAFEVQTPPATTPVAVDIKPSTCPNPLSTSDTGTYPVSIVGTNSFDVSKIDPATLKLEGVSAQTGRQVTIKDVATPYSGTITNPPLANQCTTAGADGKKDLNLKFVAKDVLSALAPVTNKEVRVLKLSGNLKSAYGGTPIQGQDVVVINKKK